MNGVQRFIAKTMESDLLEKATFVGYTVDEAISYQFRRLFLSALYMGIAAFFGYSQLWTAMVMFIGMTYVVYKARYMRIDSEYKGMRYNQQISFSVFARLIDTYLGDGKSPYIIFTKIMNRLQTDKSKASLAKLISRLQDNTDDKVAYQEFASEMSETNSALAFMMSLFYSQYSPHDQTVVKELSQMAIKEVFETINQIVEIKSDHLEKYGRFFLMASFTLLIGILLAITMMYFQKFMTPITNP